MEILAYVISSRQGINAFRLDATTGIASGSGLAAEILNPAFLAIHSSRRLLFATSQPILGREDAGAITAFAIERSTGLLLRLNTVSTGGSVPCFASVDVQGRNVLVANYVGGSVSVLPITVDGNLAAVSSSVQYEGSGVDTKRQPGPLPHSINVSPDFQFVVAVALGLDKLFVYRFDSAQGSLMAHQPPFFAARPGSGPRHVAFHPNARFLYVISEIESTVTVLNWNSIEGVLDEVETVSVLPRDFSGENFSAEIVVHPNGRFLYVSNRGHDSITVFTIAESRGTLSPVSHVPTGGRVPISFSIDPTGSYLLVVNQRSSNLVVFRIDGNTGNLAGTGQIVDVATPLCIRTVTAE